MNIIIKNLRNEQPTQPWQVRVDRSSVLGNPYHMTDESQRNAVCNMYDTYLRNKIADKNQSILNELNRLEAIYKQYNKLELFCWCAPKRCHAETIRNCLLGIQL